MKIIQTDFHGDTNIGLFAKASDKFCLVGNFLMDKTLHQMKNVLGVDVRKITIANTDLIGIFCVMNSNGLLLPRIANRRELSFFVKLKKEFGMNVTIVPSKFTAIGNLIAANDKGALISRVFSRINRKKIEDILKVKVDIGTANFGSPFLGSCIVANSNGAVVGDQTTGPEVVRISETLDLL